MECALRENQVLRQTHHNPSGDEDMLLLPLLIRAAADMGKSHLPSFIEIGAYNGIHGSQTLILERCFGWRGALIEASPQNFESMLQSSNRSSPMANHAVCNNSEGGTVQIASGGGTVAGDLSKMGRTHLRRWSRFHGNATANVPCRPLLDIYRLLMHPGATNAPSRGHPVHPITYLSLDVEGAELDVLQSVPNLDDHPFEFVLVENEYNNDSKRLPIQLSESLRVSTRRVTLTCASSYPPVS